jgi:PAS domain S-box-containing protein
MYKNKRSGKSVATSVTGQTAEDSRFKKLIENSNDGITLLDKDLQIIYRSASAERINGWNAEDRAKYVMNDLIHPDDVEIVNALFKKVLTNPGVPETGNFRSRHFNGHYIWLECTYTNFLNDLDINAIVCNYRDVSEKRQAEDALTRTVKELFAYKYALDDSAIVAITDQKGIIKHVNENFCRISKYSEAELIGKDHRIINSGYHNKAFIRNLWLAITRGDIWKGEIKNKAKDGSYYWVDTTIVPFLNDSGKPYQYVAIRSDITERKLSQDKIIESESFIKTITDNLPAMIAYWSADLNCLFANKPYMEWFEKQPDEMLGINKRDLLDKEEFKLHELHIKNVLNGIPQRFERAFHRIDGKTIATDTQYLPDIDGDVVKGFYSLIYDVTEVKLVENEIKKKTEQIENILDNITDGFIALDENMCYTYANKQVGIMLSRDPKSLIGKNVWSLFPEAIGSATYDAIYTSLTEKRIVTNEDYSTSIDLWQENRVYPSGNGVSMFIRDITKSKREEQHLKLLESVITNTTDAVLITEADPLNEPGPRIIYVNQAFTEMTGYTAAEVIGKTPRILQGPKSDLQELNRLSKAMHKGLPCEITTINYKKNGDEFWINFAVSPVNNDQGRLTHFIAIERDITERKNEELQKSLLSEISVMFNETTELNDALHKILRHLAGFGNFIMTEAWLIAEDKNKINLVAKFPKSTEMETFYNESSDIKSFKKGTGLPGIVWESQAIQFWRDLDKNKQFLRHKAAKNAGLKTAYGIPLKHNNEVIGVLVLGLGSDIKQENIFTNLFESFSKNFGTEIKRKQLELELNQVFNFTPDILCIANTDGYFKKVNPAMTVLLEYSEEELLTTPYMDLVHLQDRLKTAAELQNIINGTPTYYIENRYITKSGKAKWLAWTTTGASEHGVLYCSAKDITEKKELEVLLHKATNLARIGGWEVDLAKESVYWSDMTREILEVSSDFEPNLEKGLDFYKEGDSRILINRVISDAVENGKSWDVELEVVTARGNPKWIRVIGEPEFSEGRCIRIIGSFQEIDARKKAELAAITALEEKNLILESIGDVFFAVDENWIVTYWNNVAEKVMEKPRKETIGKNLWELYPEASPDSYQKYHEAAQTKKVIHFERYSEALKKWFAVTAYPAANGLTIYMKNISGHKQAEFAATAALMERNSILESIDDAFFAVDKNWTVTYWNNMAERVLRTPKNKVLNHNLWEVFSDSVNSESYKRYHEAVETNQAVHFEDYYQPIEKWYEISAYPADTGLSVYFKDVTDRKISDIRLRELNETLQKHTKELAISNAELEQFAYVASHDLQEPLRMVTSFMTQLEKKYGDVVDDKGRQYIHFAVDGAKRMRQIILDLLDFSRVGRTEDDLEEVNFNNLIHEISALYRRQIEEVQASIIFDDLPAFQTYKTPMRQIFQNLISNSLKYHKADEPPVIEIAGKENKTQYQFSVKDNGIGIAPEYFDKIFIIFQRLHNKDEYSGTGMGLAIAKKIIENLGGKIWVKSEEGKGSTFYFTLLKSKKA